MMTLDLIIAAVILVIIHFAVRFHEFLAFIFINLNIEATCDPPCLNGGICSLKPDEGPPKCECPANFTGEFCQTGVISTTQIINTTTPAKPCNVNNLCLNNGTCVNVDNKNGFICQCKPEFEGVLCEVEKG